MKKIIITITIIGILLNITPLSISGKENINLTLSNSGGAIQIPLTGTSMWSSELFVPGEIIVKFKEGVDVSISMPTNGAQVSGTTYTGYSMETTSTGDQSSPSSQEVIITGIKSIDELNVKHGVNSAEKFLEDDSITEFSNVYKFKLSADVLIALGDYLNDSHVEFAEPNYIYHHCATPNDPYFNQQWALHNTGQTGGKADADIDAPEAWDIETGSSDIVIAIIDTGVDTFHPDLAGNIVPGSTNDDWNGHGTHCAGIAAAVTNNGIGVAGVARGCKIMPLFAMGPIGILAEFLVSKSIVDATNNGTDVISMSLGGFSEGTLMKRAIDYADLKGVVIVAAAGNEDINVKIYPAGNPKVIAVAATDNNDSRTFFSNYGSWVDVAAPGINILSLRANGTDMYGDGSHIVDNNYYIASGTSMACPHVAGVAALVLSKKPYLTPREVRTVLRSSTDVVNSDKHIGTGRINAYEAVHKAAHVVAELDHSLDEKDVEGVVKIKGTAKGTFFQKYLVEYGRGIYPDEWKQIAVSHTPNFGIMPLAEWNTMGLDEGLYTIKLTMTTSNGFTYRDMIVVRVDNIAQTYYVDDDFNTSDDHFNKIMDAIDQYGSKDTIQVYSGTYYEHLSIGSDRSVKLIGENKETTIIDSTNTWWNSDTICISHSKLCISGFTIMPHYLSAIVTSDSNIYENNFIGEGITIIGFNPLQPSLETSSNNIISGNTLLMHSNIALIGCRKNTISDNIISEGALLLCSNKNDVNNNIIGNITTLFSSNNNDIYNNEISNGLFIVGASFNNIYDNIISDGSCGIELIGGFLFPSSFNLITRNNITNHDYGIHMTSTMFKNGFNTVSKNNISNNEYGIYIEEYNNNTEIYNNNFFENYIHAYDCGYDNVWYKPLLMSGNYWDDYQIKYPYAHQRTLMPWLWDTPYAIDGGSSKDLYPLVNWYDNSASYNSQSQSNNQQNSQSTGQSGSTQQSTTGSSTTSK